MALTAVLLAPARAGGAADAVPGPEAAVPGPGGQAGLATPVLSLRRVPALLSRWSSDARLRADLDAALADPALGGATAPSCLPLDQDGRPGYRRPPPHRPN